MRRARRGAPRPRRAGHPDQRIRLRAPRRLPRAGDREHGFIDLYKRGCFVLNAERRAEEEERHVRYLRPEYQAPETVETQAELDLDVDIGGDGAPAEPLDWPSDLKTRVQAVRAVMTHAEEPLTVDPDSGRDQHFHRARRSDVQDLLETLAALGHVEETDDGAYAT